MNIHVHICVDIWFSLRYIPTSRITESYGNSMFNLLRNYQTVFQSVCTILHSHQQCMNVPVFPQPHQHLLLFVFLIIIILVGVKWYVTMVLTCILLMANNVEYLFVCLLAICIFFWRTVYSDPLPILGVLFYY